MWNRQELKRRARRNMKNQYWRLVVVWFLVAYITGIFGDVLEVFSFYDESQAVENVVETNMGEVHQDNSEILHEFLEQTAENDSGTSSSEKNEQGENKGGPTIGKGEASQEKGPVMAKDIPANSRGVLAAVFNKVTESGGIFFAALNVINAAMGGNTSGLMMMCLGILLIVLWWLFVQQVGQISGYRFSVEAVTYQKTPVNRLLFPIKVRRIWRIAKSMLYWWVFQFLWDLTIVGGVIKYYSYYMVPFLIAENPNITGKEALTLSKAMMQGQKWKVFLLDCSFIPWFLLNALTLGVSNIFWGNPYRMQTRAQLYVQLREEAIQKEMPFFEELCDRYLTEKPTGLEGYSQNLEEYPTELYFIPEQEKRQWIVINWRRDYKLRSLILMFFSCSVIGWLWEVSLHLASEGFVNRGVLHGPWLPIYGSGGVLMLLLLKKVREKPWLTFLLAVLVSGIVEYITSWYLEISKGTKWWDYHGYFLNLNGRVCAEGLLVFGLGGCAFIYLVAPLLDELFKKIPAKTAWLLCTGLLLVFGADAIYSNFHPNTGKGITDYAAQVEEKLDFRSLETEENHYAFQRNCNRWQV